MVHRGSHARVQDALALLLTIVHLVLRKAPVSKARMRMDAKALSNRTS